MTKPNYLALVGTFGVTTALLAGGLWALYRMAPDLFPPGLTPVASTAPNPGPPKAQSTLTLLGDTFSGYSTFRNGEFQAALGDSGLTLQYGDEFDQAARAARLSQGEADLIVTTLDQFLQHQPQGRIVGLIDRTVGADAVVLNTRRYGGLTSLLALHPLVAQARDQGQPLQLVFAGDTPSEYLALVLDTKFEAFNLGDFEVVRVADASEAWAKLQDPNGTVAVAILWEPFVTQARQQGYTVVLSSEDAPEAIVDVLVASDRLIQSQPELISTLLETYYRRIDVNVRDATRLQTQIAEDGGLSPPEAGAVLAGIDFFTALEARDWMTSGTLARRMEAIAAVLVLSGRLTQVPPTPQDLWVPDFITRAATNTETLIELVRADNPALADRLAGTGQETISVTPLAPETVQAAPDIGNLNVEGQVEFAVGSAQLTPGGQTTLDTLVREIQEFNPQTVAIRVIGHTSRTGSPDLNQRLSQDRAQVVVDYLRGQGLQHNMVSEGKGFYLPIGGIPPEDPRQQRTEIRLVRVN